MKEVFIEGDLLEACQWGSRRGNYSQWKVLLAKIFKISEQLWRATQNGIVLLVHFLFPISLGFCLIVM